MHESKSETLELTVILQSGAFMRSRGEAERMEALANFLLAEDAEGPATVQFQAINPETGGYQVVLFRRSEVSAAMLTVPDSDEGGDGNDPFGVRHLTDADDSEYDDGY